MTRQNQVRLHGVNGHLETVDFQNTDPQKLICLLLDNSTSTMDNGVLAEINAGSKELVDLLLKDRIAKRRVRIAGYSFGGGIRALNNNGFVPVARYNPPELIAFGDTPLGSSILQVCGDLKDFKMFCLKAAIECGVIDVLVVTDGEPTDPPTILIEARRAMLEAEELGYARFHVYVVNGQGLSPVDSIFPRRSEPLDVSKILPMFRSLSTSLRDISRQRIDRQSNLQDQIRSYLTGRENG